MRAAAQVAGVGAGAWTTLRNMTVSAKQQVLFAYPWKSCTPIASVASSIDGSTAAESVQRPAWELDESELAGVEEGLNLEKPSLPRVVFGGAPTKDEAQVATLELKDALKKVYLGSPETGGVNGNSGSVTVERSVPKPALQAFKFLSSSPEALESNPKMGGGVMRAAAKVAGVGVGAWTTLRNMTVSAKQQVLSASLLRVYLGSPETGAVNSNSGSVTVEQSVPKPALQAFKFLSSSPEALESNPKMGGGVMRAAVKVAGVGVGAWTTLRNMTVSAKQQVLFASPRKSCTPIASVASSINGSTVAESVQRPDWELDESELPGVEEDLNLEKPSLPMVVFGGAPTKDEAQVATLELKDALTKVYLGSPETGGANGNSSSVTMERSVSKPALQLFKLLRSRPEVQKVVASVLSDENVWAAIFKNEAFAEHVKKESQRCSVVIEQLESEVDQSDVDDEVKSTEATSDLKQSSDSGSLFADFTGRVKVSVIDMANNVSGFFPNFFGGGETEKKSAEAGDPSELDHTTFGSYIMGLAVMVITVVVLKRV